MVLRTQLEDYALPPQDGRWDKHPKAEEELDISNSSSADLDLDLDIDLDQSRESLFDFDPPASNLRFKNQTIDECNETDILLSNVHSYFTHFLFSLDDKSFQPKRRLK